MTPSETSATTPSTTPPSPVKPEDTVDIALYIHEAQILLAFVTESGLEIDSATISTIVNAKHALKQKQWEREIEAQFWSAYNQLAKLAHPVSVASLKATRTFPGTPKKASLMSRVIAWLRAHGESPARRTVFRYQRLTMLVLFCLIAIQIYWLVGSTLVTQLAEKLPQQVNELLERRDELREHIPQAEWEETPQLNVIESQISNISVQSEAQYIMLAQWNQFLQRVMFFLPMVPASSEVYGAGDQEYVISLQQAQFALKAVQLYILPLLYGLLGAYAYILRQLTREIKALTYELESNIGYRLRAQLGAVAGLTIGWFTTDTSMTVLSSLSPLALAFLAGYSVEVLFTLMDKVVSSFSAKFSPGDEAASPSDPSHNNPS